MKILVSIKRVPDTDQRIQVKPDGSGLETAGLPFVVNPFDAIAVEEALRIRESASIPVEVLVVSIGEDACEEQLRTALAMGADRALLVHCGQPLDPWTVACLLRAVVTREQPDLVLMGKQAVDDDYNQTGQFLAALLDWPQATFASKIELREGALRVTRETDLGLETLRVALPAVITTDLRLNEPRYAALPSILKARKKPIDRVSAEALGVRLEPRVRVLQLESVRSQRHSVRVHSVEELITRLREEAKVM